MAALTLATALSYDYLQDNSSGVQFLKVRRSENIQGFLRGNAQVWTNLVLSLFLIYFQRCSDYFNLLKMVDHPICILWSNQSISSTVTIQTNEFFNRPSVFVIHLKPKEKRSQLPFSSSWHQQISPLHPQHAALLRKARSPVSVAAGKSR